MLFREEIKATNVRRLENESAKKKEKKGGKKQNERNTQYQQSEFPCDTIDP